MAADQIAELVPRLAGCLDGFHGCFRRSQQRSKLAHYVRGPLSDLPRKSCEPIADQAGLPARNLQEFLSSDEWDHAQARDRLQQIVVRDHADEEAIGIIDESGHPKKGTKTVCVSRQYCGRTGKVDNCVVTVHLAYASLDMGFCTMLDSTLYLPEESWEDADRRRHVGIPDSVVYRPKHRNCAGTDRPGAGQRRAFRLDHGGRMVRPETGVPGGPSWSRSLALFEDGCMGRVPGHKPPQASLRTSSASPRTQSNRRATAFTSRTRTSNRSRPVE